MGVNGMSKFMQYMKAFLGFAKAAAPIAAEVAAATGHNDVVDDINKAGQAAGTASRAADAFQEVK
jgi:hypothetical protein